MPPRAALINVFRIPLHLDDLHKNTEPHRTRGNASSKAGTVPNYSDLNKDIVPTWFEVHITKHGAVVLHSELGLAGNTSWLTWILTA